MAKVKTSPIADNEHVKEFMAILRENNVPSSQDFLAMLKQIGTMEKQLESAVKELAAMRRGAGAKSSNSDSSAKNHHRHAGASIESA